MRASKRQKKSKSASLASTSNSQQQELWCRHRDCLSPEDRETVERETKAAQAAGGSRLAVAMHLLVVRRILCGDATNPRQKKLWSAYLAANLPGFSISRAQVFRDMNGAEAAEKFPTSFLNVFITSGYALNVRPTAEEPLGKFTKPCQHILRQVNSEELSEKECLTVLADASAMIKAEAKRNRDSQSALTPDDRRERILANFLQAAISYLEDLSKAIEPGESYTSMHVRDDLELIVGRVMTVCGLEVLEVEPKKLPEEFERLRLPGFTVQSSEHTSSEGGSAAPAE